MMLLYYAVDVCSTAHFTLMVYFKFMISSLILFVFKSYCYKICIEWKYESNGCIGWFVRLCFSIQLFVCAVKLMERMTWFFLQLMMEPLGSPLSLQVPHIIRPIGLISGLYRWAALLAITSPWCLYNWFRVSIDWVMRMILISLHQLLHFSVIKNSSVHEAGLVYCVLIMCFWCWTECWSQGAIVWGASIQLPFISVCRRLSWDQLHVSTLYWPDISSGSQASGRLSPFWM